MNRFLVISFQFREASYYSLIMCKAKIGWTEYRITVMNGELEKLLFGNNVVREINGYLYLDISGNEQQGRLKREIVRSLVEVIRIPIKE